MRDEQDLKCLTICRKQRSNNEYIKKKNPQLAKGSGRFGINSTYVYVHACTHTRADTLLCVVSVVVFQENLLGGGIARDEP